MSYLKSGLKRSYIFIKEGFYYSYQVEIKSTLSSYTLSRKRIGEVYAARVRVRKRNKIILGLLVYQGISTSELQRIRTEEVELYKGKSNRLSNIIYALTKELKTINNSFVNMQQISNRQLAFFKQSKKNPIHGRTQIHQFYRKISAG
jgi:integrase